METEYQIGEGFVLNRAGLFQAVIITNARMTNRMDDWDVLETHYTLKPVACSYPPRMIWESCVPESDLIEFLKKH